MPNSTTPSLEYAPNVLDPRSLRIVRGFYRAALFCALVPMVAGIAILIAFWATYANWLIGAGLLMFPIGTCMVIVGLCFCIVCGLYQRKARRNNLAPPLRKWRLPLAAALLLANFPLALLCAGAGFLLETSQIVDIINETGSTIDECIVQAPDDRRVIKSIPNGYHRRTRLHSIGDGEVSLTVTQAGKSEKIVVQGYISGNGFHSRVHVKPGPASTVEQLR